MVSSKGTFYKGKGKRISLGIRLHTVKFTVY